VSSGAASAKCYHRRIEPLLSSVSCRREIWWLAAPTIAVARGRFVGEPVIRREFHRTDTIVIRVPLRSSRASAGQTVAKGTPTVSGRLLDRRGQTRIACRSHPLLRVPEIRQAVGSLGPGDYASS